MRTDDFTLKTKRLLAHRVGHRCSNPECRAATSGPGLEADKPVTAGDAAHITAASPIGPRYDPSLSSDQRRSYDNGIWLCVNHARIVDQDDSRHTIELLRRWKSQAENQALKDLGRPQDRKVPARAEVTSFVTLANCIIVALKNYNEESTMLGIEGRLTQMADVAQSLGIPVPIEIHTSTYPEGIIPATPFNQNRFEGTVDIRFPDGSKESGKVWHATGLELLVEARDSAIVALEQWAVVLAEPE
jgi:hypothetical protein